MAKSKRPARVSSATTNTPSSTATPPRSPPVVDSLRELNTKLLSRIRTAECAAQRLERQHEADVVAIAELQQQLGTLEQRAAGHECDIAAMREAACEREREMREMGKCAARREEEMGELEAHSAGYERELKEIQGVVGRREVEVGELRERWGEAERERGELKEQVVEGEKVIEELRGRVRELEEGWGRGLSISSIGSSWMGKASPGRGEVEVGRMSLWERFQTWVGGLWRWLFCGRGREAEPLLGRVA